MLEVRDLEVAYGGSAVLRGADLRAEGFTGLVGRNGAGKTTLMRAVMGLVRVRRGAVRLRGMDITALPPHRRARLGVGYMPEDRRLVPALTVEENLLLPGWARGSAAGALRCEWVFGLMPEVAAMRGRRALALSGGQQKMVALARALVAGESLLLLDEPFEGVAPALAGRLAEVLGRIRGEGTTVLLSESETERSRELFDRRYVIERGAVAPEGQGPGGQPRASSRAASRAK